MAGRIATRGHIGLDADDRLDPGRLSSLGEVHNAVEHAVIGNGNRRLTICCYGFTKSLTRAAPSSIENSVCTCRCANPAKCAPVRTTPM
jgi:hypothetical protein